MEEKTLKCTLITPLYSYGAYQNKIPEIRTSQLKGIMRYTYRIACPARYTKNMFANETHLFGGAAGDRPDTPGQASPLRLLVREGSDIRMESAALLYHKATDSEKNPAMNHFKEGSFSVTLRLNRLIRPQIQPSFEKIDLDWYVDIAALSLMLCGLGRRSRKGRGSVFIDEKKFESPEAALTWICSVLNRIAVTTKGVKKSAYKRKELEIIPEPNYGHGKASNHYFNYSKITRPIIQKIRIGGKLGQCSTEQYLKALDLCCHNLELKKIKDDAGVPLDKYITGNEKYKDRLASPLIISLLRIGEDIYPLYTFVKALAPLNRDHNAPASDEFDPDCRQRMIFIKHLENSMKGRR